MGESGSSACSNYLLISYTKWNNFKQEISRCLTPEHPIACGLGQVIWDEQSFENGSLTDDCFNHGDIKSDSMWIFLIVVYEEGFAWLGQLTQGKGLWCRHPVLVEE